MNFVETWASDPTVHNRYTPAGTTCTNVGNSYKSIAVDLLGKLKDHHTDVQARMASLKTSLDGILTPDTATGIGTINTLINDDIIPALNTIDTQLTPLMTLAMTSTNAFATNLNCSFIKDILDEIYPELTEINEGMLHTSYLSLSTILILLLVSLGSFFLSQCFPRQHKQTKKKIDGKLKDATNKIVPISKKELQRAGTGDYEKGIKPRAKVSTKIRRK